MAKENIGNRSLKTSYIALAAATMIAIMGAYQQARGASFTVDQILSDSIGYNVTNDSGFTENEWRLSLPGFDLTPYMSMDFGHPLFYNVAQDNANDVFVVTSGIGLQDQASVGARINYDTTDENSPWFGLDLRTAGLEFITGTIDSFSGGVPTTSYSFNLYDRPETTNPAPVPEPGTKTLLGTGLLGLLGVGGVRRKRKENPNLSYGGAVKEVAKDGISTLGTIAKVGYENMKDSCKGLTAKAGQYFNKFKGNSTAQMYAQK